MNINLPPELEQFIHEKVDSGEYQSPADVVGDAIQLLKERDRNRGEKLERLRQDIAEGADQADRGEFVDPDPAFDEIENKLRARITRQ